MSLTHDFEIGEHEVTIREWEALGFSHRPQKPLEGQSLPGFCEEADCPVIAVSWFEATAYANALSTAHRPPLPECYELLCSVADGGRVCSGIRSEPTVLRMDRSEWPARSVLMGLEGMYH